MCPIKSSGELVLYPGLGEQAMPHAPKSAAMEACIKACNDCAQSCLETHAHCLEMGGEHASRGHITLLADCADICATSVAFMGRGSELHGKVCAACAAVCEACAKSCESMPGSDATMKRCAEACRKCEAECRKMAA